MQARHRSSGDGTRSYSSGYRSYCRGGFSRGHLKPYRPPPPPPLPRRKADILLEAGRLAADYLVSQGLLPPSLLPRKQNRVFRGLKSRDRELEGRGSAFSRLGSSVLETHGRGRFDDDDEYNHVGSGRRRGPYSRSYGRDGRDGRDDRWTERSSSRYSDDSERKDDYAPPVHQERQWGLDDVDNSVSRSGGDEQNSGRESGSENHGAVDDTGSKASSSSTRKDQLPEVDVVMSKEHDDDDDDDAKVANSDKMIDVKSDASAEDKGLDLHVDAVDGDSFDKCRDDLLKLFSFARMPTKPRSYMVPRNCKVEQSPMTKESDMNGVTSIAFKAVAEDELTGRLACDSYADQGKDLESKLPNVSGIVAHKNMEEAVDLQNEPNENLPGFGMSNAADEEEDVSFEQHADQRNRIKRKRELTSQEIPEEDDYPTLNDSKAKLGSPYFERIPSDEVMLESIDQDKSDSAVLSSKAEADAALKLEEEKQFDPAAFKTCDLNLMETPEATEIPDDPIVDTLWTTVSTIKPEEEAPIDFGLSIGNNANGPDVYSTVSGGEKTIPIIDLEDDSPIEKAASKPKNDMMYSGLENFLKHADHTDDLHGIQDRYPPAISEFMGSDIPGCPSVSSDMNNLQTGLDLHSAEAPPGVDDSLYISFEELPLGFMDGWDQPPQEFGKFF